MMYDTNHEFGERYPALPSMGYAGEPFPNADSSYRGGMQQQQILYPAAVHREYQQQAGELPRSSYNPVPQEVRLGGVLSYLLGWFSALFFLLFAWQNRFIRFHALQSFLFFGGIGVFDVSVFYTLHRYADEWHFGAFLLILVFLLVNLIAVVSWFIGIVQAASGNYYRLPLVGMIVEHMLKRPESLKEAR